MAVRVINYISLFLFRFELLCCRKFWLIIPLLSGRFSNLLFLEHLKDEARSGINFTKDAIRIDAKLLLSSDLVQKTLIRGPPRNNLACLACHNMFVEIFSLLGLLLCVFFSFFVKFRIYLPFQSHDGIFMLLSFISYGNEPFILLVDKHLIRCTQKIIIAHLVEFSVTGYAWRVLVVSHLIGIRDAILELLVETWCALLIFWRLVGNCSHTLNLFFRRLLNDLSRIILLLLKIYFWYLNTHIFDI